MSDVTPIVTAAGQAGPRAPSREQQMSQARAAGRRAAAERGSLTLMLAVMFVAILALAGLVIDGGAKLEAAENATAAAQEAARAGAGMVDRATAYSSGQIVVDRGEAIQAAEQYLNRAGYRDWSVSPDGNDAIQVSVTVSEPARVLSLIGISTLNATGRATAELVSGVTGAGR